jgi:hypothetical protein
MSEKTKDFLLLDALSVLEDIAGIARQVEFSNADDCCPGCFWAAPEDCSPPRPTPNDGHFSLCVVAASEAVANRIRKHLGNGPMEHE